MSNARLKQNSQTKRIKPEVRIISMTSNPVGTIFSLWYGSRHSDRVNPEEIQALYDVGDTLMMNKDYQNLAERICKAYPEHAGLDGKDYKGVIFNTVKQVIQADLPPTESVLFNVEVDNANVAWREQLVRSKFASYWTQTSRTQDMTTMDVNMNESIELLGGQEAVHIYEQAVESIRSAYRILSNLGVPMEDIRLQPQGHTHRVYWMIDLRSLIKIMNKRCDWIAQASLWTPIIAGLCSELRRLNLMDLFKGFIGHPLAKVAYDKESEEYIVSDHPQMTENEDRFYGRDPLPCDPLWLAYTNNKMPERTNLDFYDYLKSMYIQIWDDPYLEVIGWDREHPEKLSKYDRP